MGIEYSINSEKFDKDKCIELMPKITSATDAKVEFDNDTYEFRFNKEQTMPDLVIYLNNNGSTITYNGGNMNSWSIVGLFLSLVSEWFGPITMDEL